MTQARRTAGIVARAALWATWAAAMVFAPAVMHYFGYVESVPAGWEHLFDLWFFVPWSAAPVFALAVAALAYAYRDWLAPRRRAARAAAAVALVAYLGLAAAYYLGLDGGSFELRWAIGFFERVARYAAWGLWGVALVAWVMPVPGAAEPPASPLDRRPGADTLTEREREVAELLVSGSTQAQAAEALGISASSVSTYRARACEKLGLASLDELVPRAHGADAAPPALDVGQMGSMPLMGLALVTGMSARTLADSLRYWTPYSLPDLALLVGAWALPWVALLVYARLRDMRVRHREVRARLYAVLATLALLGFFAYGSLEQRIWGLALIVLAAYVACVALLAPYLLWPRERVGQTLDVERCVLYLRGRGAGELQARVLAEIALGRATPEICESLHVARGTVSAYRAQGYERLGVHSSRELADLLARDVGFVPSAGKNQPSADSEKSTE